jgi:hypothetical protein
VFFEVLGHLLVALLTPFLGNRSGDGEGLFSVGSGEDRPEVRPELLAPGVAHHAEEVPGVMDLAPLVGCSLKVASDGAL